MSAGAKPFAGGTLPPPNVPVVSILDDLKARALAGDVRAACRIAVEFARCADAEELEARHGARRKNLERDRAEGHPKLASLEEMFARTEKAIADNKVACLGLDIAETKNAFDYLLAAAQGGNRHAMITFVINPPNVDVERPMNTIELWAEYKANATSLLERAIAEGDPQAYSFAAQASVLRVWGGFDILKYDPVQAIAYLSALKQAYPWQSRELDGRIEHLRTSKNLSVEAVQEGITRGNALAGRLPNKPGPDATRPEVGVGCER